MVIPLVSILFVLFLYNLFRGVLVGHFLIKGPDACLTGFLNILFLMLSFLIVPLSPTLLGAGNALSWRRL